MKEYVPMFGLALLPVVVFTLLSTAMDTDRDPLDVIEAQRSELAQKAQSDTSYYVEEYTSARFIDLRRAGSVHPLLEEYAAELDACNLSTAHTFDYSLSINADGRSQHLTIDSAMADCIKFALRRIPFESLAPPSGTLVLSGRLHVADLDPFRPPQSSTIAPAPEYIGYNKDFFNHYKNGGKLNEKLALSDVEFAALTERLGCPSPYSLVRLEASYESSPFGDGEIQVDTTPKVPCVEERAREHIKDIPHDFFKPDFTPKTITMKLNLVLPDSP